MSEPVTVSECVKCGYVAYPPRLLCPVCGGGEWKQRPAGSGVVTELTVRSPVLERRQLPNGEWLDEREPVRLVAVRSDAGARIIARAAAAVEAGDRVTLVKQRGAATALPAG